MSLNSNVLCLLPENWRPLVIPSQGGIERVKYTFKKGGKSSALYGPDGKPVSSTDVTPIINGDLRGSREGVSFLRLSPEGTDLLHRVKSDVSLVTNTLQSINLTGRLQRSDLGKREANAREAEIGIMHVHHQCNIETLQQMLSQMGLKLSDISHLIAACRLPQVHSAIQDRFRKMGVEEVAVGSESGEEGPIFREPQRGINMPIAQLLYGKGAVKLDVTHPKPNGVGYAPGHALWVVEKK